MNATSRIAGCATLLLAVLLFVDTAAAQNTDVTLDWKVPRMSRTRQVLTNFGTLLGHPVEMNYPGLIRAEFPAGSAEEHIGEGGFWVGGITEENDTLVTSTLSWSAAPFWETYPTDAPWDTVWVVPRGETVDVGDPAAPYLPGYVGVSDMDLVARYTDYGPLSDRAERHTSMGLEFIQRTYSWSSPPGLDEVLVFNFDIVSHEQDLRQVYFTFWLDPNVGIIQNGANFLDDYSLFFDDLKLAVGVDAEGGTDGTSISPIGAMLLPPKGAGELEWTWKWGSDPYAPGMIPPEDGAKYRQLMAAGEIMPDQQTPTGSHFTLSVGPFDLAQGDTLHMQAAEVFGDGLADLLDNARLIRRLAAQDFRLPAPPPMPPLRVEARNHEVRLGWTPTAAVNPETYEDPNRADGAEQPFEGYRVYKSSTGPDGPWTLLAEYDVAGNGYANDFGLGHALTESMLVNNVEYYYSVTAFSKPDTAFGAGWPSQESSISANAVTVVPGTPPPSSVGDVAVVPNPYRGDVAYQDYDPAWERPPAGRGWLEQDRRLQFINLPPRCRIQIYTPAGDLVQTLRSEQGGFLDWNMTSSVGQAIASGLYVFAVEDLDTGKVQVGKFAVIK